MKHQSYIRSLFVAFCAFFVCVSAMAETVHLNPFAFKLSSSLSGDVFTVTYYLNAPATDVKVSIDINNDGKIDANDVVYNCNAVKNTKGTTLVKGIYTATISLREKINELAAFRDKKKLHWYVDVKGGNQPSSEYTSVPITYDKYRTNTNKQSVTYYAKVLNAQEVTKQYKFVFPSSIAIDNNTNSDNFGMIYCTESRLLTTGTAPNDALADGNTRLDYFTYWKKDGNVVGGTGLYVFDAAFQNMPSTASSYDFVTPKTDDDRTIGRGYDMGISTALSSKTPFYTEYKNDKGNDATQYTRPLGPRRVRLSDDGSRLFLTLFATTGKVLIERPVSLFSYVDKPSVKNVFNVGTNGLVLDDTDRESYLSAEYYKTNVQSSYTIETSNNQFVAGPNIAFDVHGNNNDLKLLMVSGARYSIPPYLQESFRCDEYNLGAENTWTTIPSRSGWFDRKVNNNNNNKRTNTLYINTYNDNAPVPFVTSYDQVGIAYDQKGGFWLLSNRDLHSEMASLVHFNENQEITFAEYWSNRGRAAIKYIDDYSKLIVAGGPFVRNWTSESKSKEGLTGISGKYGHPAAKGSGEEWWVTIYTVNKDNISTPYINTSSNDSKTYMNSTPTHRTNLFTDSLYVRLSTKAEEVAMDYADNLYVVSGANEYIKAYALPRTNKVASTPCKQNYYFDSDTYLLTITIAPANTGKVLDNEFQKEYRYYMKDAKFKLLAIPETGYRFYCWDEYDIPYPQTIGATLTSEHTMTGNYNRTAHFGIDVWETKPIIQTNKEMTFRGVWVQRELDTKSYSTICLPFHLESLEGTPYEGASVLEFTGAVPSNVEGDNRISLNFTEVEFVAGKGMKAGVPYLIKLETAIASGEEKIFKNVTCPPIREQGETVTYKGVTFHGMLNPTTFDKDDIQDKLFLTADNRLVSLYGQQENFTINGLRGYFTVSGDMAKTAEFVLNLPEKVTTSIPMVNLADSLQVTKYLWNGQIYIQRGNEVYDLSGARVK